MSMGDTSTCEKGLTSFVMGVSLAGVVLTTGFSLLSLQERHIAAASKEQYNFMREKYAIH
jgi:hypothetical protein